jgi:hypothetical protein
MATPTWGRTGAVDPVPTWWCFVADTRASRGVEIVDGATVCVAVVGSRTEAELLAATDDLAEPDGGS